MEQEIYFGRTERGNNNFIQPKDRFFKNPAIALYIKRIIGLECFDKMNKETRKYLISNFSKELEEWKRLKFGSSNKAQEHWVKRRGFKNRTDYEKWRLKRDGFNSLMEYFEYCAKNAGFKNYSERRRYWKKKQKGDEN